MHFCLFFFFPAEGAAGDRPSPTLAAEHTPSLGARATSACSGGAGRMSTPLSPASREGSAPLSRARSCLLDRPSPTRWPDMTFRLGSHREGRFCAEPQCRVARSPSPAHHSPGSTARPCEKHPRGTASIGGLPRRAVAGTTLLYPIRGQGRHRDGELAQFMPGHQPS